MKQLLFVISLLWVIAATAQQNNTRRASAAKVQMQQYLTFNPLGLAEPQLTAGIGFGNRFTRRSEYFTELSYIGKHPSYGFAMAYLHGMRFIAQYRYHFLQQWKPLLKVGIKRQERAARIQPFIAAEFRIKPFNFSAKNSFVRKNPADTLNDFAYEANALSVGGAIVFGSTYNISANGRWKIELTAGIGAKQKFVRYKNVPAGYERYTIKRIDLGAPQPDEAIGLPYFPFCMRIKYMIQ